MGDLDKLNRDKRVLSKEVLCLGRTFYVDWNEEKAGFKYR